MLAQENHMPKSFLTKTTHFHMIPKGKYTHESQLQSGKIQIHLLLDYLVSDTPNLRLGYSDKLE